MGQKHYIVDLTTAGQELEAILRTENHAARKLTRTRIVLQRIFARGRQMKWLGALG